MDNRVNVAVTGYFRTGSSAIVDLLKEYNDVRVVPYENKSYEHSLFYHHNGLYDVCTLLSHGNTAYTSDKVISQFVTEMKRLNDYNYVWFGSYHKQFGNKFMDLVYEFVDSIAEHREDRTVNHIKKTRFSLAKLCAQVLLLIIKKKRFTNPGVWYVYDKEECYCALPDHDQLFAAAKRFTSGYFSLFNSQNENELKIFDHIIWPGQIDEFKECFEDNFKIIVVDRDPRDLYSMERHMPTGKKSHFPIEQSVFAKEWKNTVVQSFENKNTLRIHFEDLIYHYEETVKSIEDFLGLDSNQHSRKKQYFIPEQSIENTQVFRANKEWEEEIREIEMLIPELLYDFPETRIPDRSRMFADDGIGKVKI